MSPESRKLCFKLLSIPVAMTRSRDKTDFRTNKNLILTRCVGVLLTYKPTSQAQDVEYLC